MLSKSLLMAAVLVAGTTHFATARNTPIEAFIRHEMEVRDFATVNNIWQADNAFDKAQLLTKVENVLPLSIDYTALGGFMKAKMKDINLVVPKAGGGTYTINLGNYDFLPDNFKIEAVGEHGSAFKPYERGLYYRGVVAGIPGSVAAFSFFNNEVYGIFSIPDEGNYVLVPNTQVGQYYDRNPHYILYNDLDLKIKDKAPGCAADNLPDMQKPAGKATTQLANNVYNNCRDVKVYEFADYATYKSKGYSTTTVTNYLTSLFNNQSTLYRNEGILISMDYLKIDTATDVYYNLGQSSIKFLDMFGYQTQNNLNGCDLGIMFSTRYGNLGGVAWIQSMCSAYYAPDSAGAYAFCNIDNNNVVNFPTYSWDVEVSTHEMGHVVGSPHTHRCCWNPPARNTAIDGCYTLEGGCPTPNPAKPVGGGTIMSYCHLTNVGINFSKGFSQQPGDTVRYFIGAQGGSCAPPYYPDVALAKANRTITANRECTDIGTAVTYYWNDNNTASHADDTLVLMMKKGSNSIGTLDSTGFSVKASTITGYSGGTGDTTTFPAGTPNIDSRSYAMRRYWQIAATTQPTTAVEVIFPFLQVDTSDVHGSIPTAAQPLSNYLMYVTKNGVDPNPANNFPSATASNLNIYTYNASLSAGHWTFSNVGGTYLAHMQTTNLNGGGSGFITTHTHTAGVTTTNGNDAGIFIYPNPTSGQWFVSTPDNTGKDMAMQLYSADGKMVQLQTLKSGAINIINTASLAKGVYFYRIVNNEHTYVGNLVKE